MFPLYEVVNAVFYVLSAQFSQDVCVRCQPPGYEFSGGVYVAFDPLLGKLAGGQFGVVECHRQHSGEQGYRVGYDECQRYSLASLVLWRCWLGRRWCRVDGWFGHRRLSLGVGSGPLDYYVRVRCAGGLALWLEGVDEQS